MKVAVCICVYNETTLLKACLKQFPEWISKILVLVSEVPWKGHHAPDEILTVDLLRATKDPRLEWVRMHWRNEQDQRNWGLGRLSDSDWVLTLDADEFFTTEGWETLRHEMSTLGQTDVLTASMKTYWKTPEWRWAPEDLHKPTIAVRPRKTAFWDKREVSVALNRISRATMYHFSWVRTDAEVFQKIQNYMHANDFDRDKWYNDVWLAWTPEMKNLRPYGSDPLQRAVYDPAPDSVRNLFAG